MNNGQTNWAGRLCAGWGVIGFAWILMDAIIRLSILADEGISGGLTVFQWVLLVGFVVFMAYAEGYRGFQKSFSPRTAARAYYLYKHPDLLAGLLAPLFCMGFFRATRKPFLFAWVGTTLIVMLIIALRFVPQPWRAIVDAGVVVGLSWGLISFALCVQAEFKGEQHVSPEVPGHESA